MTMDLPHRYMDLAIREARRAFALGEVPVGALLALPDGRTFAGHNGVRGSSPLDHAEMVCLQNAIQAGGGGHLEGAVLYVTAEPCLMCLGAMVHARIGGLVYACPEPRFGGVDLLQALWKEGRYPHRFPVASGLREGEARRLLKEFFARKRAGGGTRESRSPGAQERKRRSGAGEPVAGGEENQ